MLGDHENLSKLQRVEFIKYTYWYLHSGKGEIRHKEKLMINIKLPRTYNYFVKTTSYGIRGEMKVTVLNCLESNTEDYITF